MYANTYSHEGKEINIGIKDVERMIRSFKKSRICGSEGICAEFLKNGTEKLYRMLSNIISQNLNRHPIRSMESSTSTPYTKKDPRRILTIIEKFRCQVQ